MYLGSQTLRGIECRPWRGEGVSAAYEGGELRLRSGEGERLSLNAFGRSLWAACEGQSSVDEIVERLRDEHGLTDRHARVDTIVLLQRMRQAGLVHAPGLLARPSDEDRRISLADVTFYVINCPDAVERRQFMSEQLERLGLRHSFVEGRRIEPPKFGVSLSHLKVLTREDIQVPFAILEDDCEFQRPLPEFFELPLDADALYLGVSHFGSRVPGQLSRSRFGAVRWVPHKPALFRVFNMFARHAVVFLTEQFRENALRSSLAGLLVDGKKPVPGDACCAMLHASHLVLTPTQPYCHQSSKLRGFELETRHPLDHRWPPRMQARRRLEFGKAPRPGDLHPPC